MEPVENMQGLGTFFADDLSSAAPTCLSKMKTIFDVISPPIVVKNP
jgi:hypothetical protein